MSLSTVFSTSLLSPLVVTLLSFIGWLSMILWLRQRRIASNLLPALRHQVQRRGAVLLRSPLGLPRLILDRQGMHLTARTRGYRNGLGADFGTDPCMESDRRDAAVTEATFEWPVKGDTDFEIRSRPPTEASDEFTSRFEMQGDPDLLARLLGPTLQQRLLEWGDRPIRLCLHSGRLGLYVAGHLTDHRQWDQLLETAIACAGRARTA